MPSNPPNLPPAQIGFVLTIVVLVVLAFVCMLILKAAIWLAERRAGVAYRWEPPASSPPPSPIRRWIADHAARTEARYTPRRYVVLQAGDLDPIFDPVCIPVSHTSMPATGMDVNPPDIDAEKHEMPRLSRDITEADELVLLCVVRNRDGKYRHSANKIFELVGGDRNIVMKRIKEIRETPIFRQDDGTTAPASHPITGQQ